MDFASLFSSAPPMLAKPTFGDPVPPMLARQAIPPAAPVVAVPAAAVRPVDPYAAGQGVTNGVYSAANAVGQGFNNLPGVTRVNDGLTGADNFVRGLFGADRRDAAAPAVAAPAAGKVAVAAPAAAGFNPAAALAAQPLWSDGLHGVPAIIQNQRDGVYQTSGAASPATAAAASMPANPLVGAAQAFAAANGGISMHQLQGLSDAFSKSQKSEPKAQTAADAAIADAHEATKTYFTKALEGTKGDNAATLKLLDQYATRIGALGNPSSAAVANLVNPTPPGPTG